MAPPCFAGQAIGSDKGVHGPVTDVKVAAPMQCLDSSSFEVAEKYSTKWVPIWITSGAQTLELFAGVHGGSEGIASRTLPLLSFR